jgi:hypothetical protein
LKAIRMTTGSRRAIRCACPRARAWISAERGAARVNFAVAVNAVGAAALAGLAA